MQAPDQATLNDWAESIERVISEQAKKVRATITLYPIGRPVRATITLYPIGRPVRATITLYPIGRSTITLYPIGRSTITLYPIGRSTITLYPIGRSTITLYPMGRHCFLSHLLFLNTKFYAHLLSKLITKFLYLLKVTVYKVCM